ncbi:hypothetical protein GWN63_05165 [Candidatus Bathyarchaeota archaeon]|nr:hypothetical protein [Candidatus Bathyarchaeota archaeon]NIU81615.1 hypothetical protein [Candidatus Bathyarchaeota archaeon]NIV68260.1 hypothetical protein [Candidatus Bathyarchaeota archaeon]NIW16601.1 hypothetical protein [Candidatus Bathyarchaeota archaeon]NIW34801.1 hypothetical protein [Candidatus Bathyarchaeota archaeon]
MEISEKRIVGSLLLLSGLTLLLVAMYAGQLEYVKEVMKEIFETAVAGVR